MLFTFLTVFIATLFWFHQVLLCCPYPHGFLDGLSTWPPQVLFFPLTLQLAENGTSLPWLPCFVPSACLLCLRQSSTSCSCIFFLSAPWDSSLWSMNIGFFIQNKTFHRFLYPFQLSSWISPFLFIKLSKDVSTLAAPSPFLPDIHPLRPTSPATQRKLFLPGQYCWTQCLILGLTFYNPLS